jgi:hypothetical protein
MLRRICYRNDAIAGPILLGNFHRAIDVFGGSALVDRGACTTRQPIQPLGSRASNKQNCTQNL